MGFKVGGCGGGRAEGLTIIRQSINIFMQAKRGERMVRAERIAFFQAQRERKTDYNPEEDATNNLLEISNQDYDFIEQDGFSTPTSRQEPTDRPPRSSRRVPVAQNFTKSHRNWRKNSVNFLSGEEVCVMRKERVVNLSNFLIFDNEELLRSSPEPRPKLEELDSPRPSRNSKMLVNFIRKRNLNYQREAEEETGSGWKRVGSPLQRVNHSCELKRDREQPWRQTPKDPPISRVESGLPSDFRATSPNFRNKKVINYFKYRLSRNPEPARP